ncbi:hypothetical protein M752DRAFT_277425 [Aspergillus phoenicis ATCC 13157]|uniref:Uncharacterized protein n=1 Tax=Aspergillus phoenicis ATCC 13157 TaxID=1353007 RepID=A0A370PEV9_ASPPH|nr:hypothetical protein M752DRAFT_277425 [Aspergillus phoenicis ATCC 13157]
MTPPSSTAPYILLTKMAIVKCGINLIPACLGFLHEATTMSLACLFQLFHPFCTGFILLHGYDRCMW